MSNPLRWDVFVSDEIPVVTRDLPPGMSERRWSPISSTLISGQRGALLVDTFITVEQNPKLVEWIAKSGKNLTTSYATHGHGDQNDVHVDLAESNTDTRKEWISALDTIESLKPHTVVAGHKRPGRADTPSVVGETRQYIRDFDRIASDTRTAKDLYNEMLALYPDRVNPGAFWSSARGVKG